MTVVAQQTSLPFMPEPSYRPEDFMTAAENEEAWQWVQGWPDWPGRISAIYGPQGSGKTHLGHIWREKTQAAMLDPQRLGTVTSEELLHSSDCWLLDGLEDFLQQEEAFFHLYNSARERQCWLLCLARTHPAKQPVGLPDLRSRLSAIPAVTLREPDDALLEAVLAKQLADRQLRVPPEVMTFLTRRMERSFAAVGQVVSQLDQLSWQEKRRITLPLARRLFTGEPAPL